jgi:hypothetical protein
LYKLLGLVENGNFFGTIAQHFDGWSMDKWWIGPRFIADAPQGP